MPSSITEVMEALRQKYAADKNLASSWEHEEQRISAILPIVNEQIVFNYDLESPLGIGGSGIVISVTDRNLSTKRALKIARPSPGKEQLLAYVLEAETEHLRRLSHQNLIRIFAKGAVKIEKDLYPYYIMDYVEGAKDSDRFLSTPGLTEHDLLQIFQGVLDAIVYMHSQDEIHMDIKPGNILITPSGVPIISDLGFAKRITVETGQTLIGGTQGFIHPDALRFVTEVESDPNRLRGKAFRSSLSKVWDLYSLGKTLLRLLACFMASNQRALSPYTHRYLRLLACRLLDGHNEESERALGLSLPTLKEIKYSSAMEALTDLKKLTGVYNLATVIPELNLFGEDTIQVSTLSTTPFTPRIRGLISHPVMMRLGSCTQLGLLNLIYPTATHTRLEHSIGTFSVICRYVLALYYDPLNPLFRQLMNDTDLRAVLLAALLHDIGQYPLAHDLEEADKETFSHLTIGFRILGDPDKKFRELVEGEGEDRWNVPLSRVVAILEARPEILQGTLKDRILHSLIDGPIDADKIDYLLRDSRHLGLSYGNVIDFERLLRVLTVVFREEDKGTYAALGIHEKGKVPAEAVAFARYAMFGQVYWHHAYRAIKAMIHRVVWEMLDRVEDGERAGLREEFRAFVAAAPGANRGQAVLFAAANLIRPVDAPYSGYQIQESDFAVLRWIADRGGEGAGELFSALNARSLFKRVLVLSRERALDKQLWDDLSEFYATHRRRWRKKLKLQRKFQERIREHIVKPPAEVPQSAVITADARNRLLADIANKPVVLVDFPPERKGSATELEYVIEGDRRRAKADELKTGTLEHSIVWETLRDKFHESIGKVRVYCHPDHAALLNALVPPEDLERALALSLRDVIQESD